MRADSPANSGGRRTTTWPVDVTVSPRRNRPRSPRARRSPQSATGVAARRSCGESRPAPAAVGASTGPATAASLGPTRRNEPQPGPRRRPARSRGPPVARCLRLTTHAAEGSATSAAPARVLPLPKGPVNSATPRTTRGGLERAEGHGQQHGKHHHGQASPAPDPGRTRAGVNDDSAVAATSSRRASSLATTSPADPAFRFTRGFLGADHHVRERAVGVHRGGEHSTIRVSPPRKPDEPHSGEHLERH